MHGYAVCMCSYVLMVLLLVAVEGLKFIVLVTHHSKLI